MSTGHVALVAARRDGRTVLERVRYDGIARCSRALTHGGETHVLLAQLGPGVMGGDALTLEGSLRDDAELTVGAQTATRVLGGTARDAASHASWRLAAGAHLTLIGQPVLAAADAAFLSDLRIDLSPGSSAIVAETVAVARGARVVVRTTLSRSGREWLVDALDATASAPLAVGTLFVALDDAARADALFTLLEAVAARARDTGVRMGLGGRPGAIVVRAAHTDVWTVWEWVSHLAAAAAGERRESARIRENGSVERGGLQTQFA